MKANRVVVGLLFIFGLAAAIAPAAASMNTQSVAGVITGAGVIAAAGIVFLKGWQAYEERTQAGIEELPGVPTGTPEDEPPPEMPDETLDGVTAKGEPAADLSGADPDAPIKPVEAVPPPQPGQQT